MHIFSKLQRVNHKFSCEIAVIIISKRSKQSSLATRCLHIIKEAPQKLRWPEKVPKQGQNIKLKLGNLMSYQ